MRVLHVIPGLGAGGGAEQSLLADAEAVRASGIALDIAILFDRRALVPALEARGVVVHDLSAATSVLARTRAIRRLIAELDPDVVHATLFDADIPAQLAVGRSGRPLLITWAGTSYSNERRSEPGIHWGKLRGFQFAETVLAWWSRAQFQAVTAGVATSNGAALRVPASRIHVAERGRPAPEPRDPERRRATRASLGLSDDDRLVLCVARHEPQKGLDRVIAAADRLQRAGTPVTLMIAGREGSLTPAHQAQISAASHPERLQLLGQRDDIDRLLESADVFVSSSRHEGAAGAVIEAMSWSLPIVATQVLGLTGILDDDVNALVVADGDDIDAFAAAIGELLADDERAQRLGRAARALYDERFTSARSSSVLAALYRSLAVGRDTTPTA